MEYIDDLGRTRRGTRAEARENGVRDQADQNNAQPDNSAYAEVLQSNVIREFSRFDFIARLDVERRSLTHLQEATRTFSQYTNQTQMLFGRNTYKQRKKHDNHTMTLRGKVSHNFVGPWSVVAVAKCTLYLDSLANVNPANSPSKSSRTISILSRRRDPRPSTIRSQSPATRD